MQLDANESNRSERAFRPTFVRETRRASWFSAWDVPFTDSSTGRPPFSQEANQTQDEKGD